jgi:hypothetical protein
MATKKVKKKEQHLLAAASAVAPIARK